MGLDRTRHRRQGGLTGGIYRIHPGAREDPLRGALSIDRIGKRLRGGRALAFGQANRITPDPCSLRPKRL